MGPSYVARVECLARLHDKPRFRLSLVALDASSPVELLRFLTRMPQPSACKVCGHPVFNAKNHDVPAARAAKMFPAMICKCGKPARVRCFNGVGTYWVECEDGHGRGRPA